jgi:hypothetical protein
MRLEMMLMVHYLGAESPRRIFDDYVRGIDYQHDLIDRKITWLLTSQTILFAALAFTAADTSSTKLVYVIASTGLAICVTTFVGVFTNGLAKRRVYEDYRDYEAEICREIKRIANRDKSAGWRVPVTSALEFGVRTRLTKIGIRVNELIPIIFAGAWISVITLAGDIIDGKV